MLNTQTNRMYHKVLFNCFLILALTQLIYGTSVTFVNFPNLINNSQIVNASYYEYKVDQSVNTNSYQRGQVTSKMSISRANGSKANLTAITWAHAVNSQQLLNEALSGDIDFIEADIVMGKLNDTGADLPVMAHPPANSSDISLDSFLLQIKNYNDNHTEEMKGVKLDFKSIEVFEGSLETLKAKIPEMTYPIWLNADIIKGPVNSSGTPVDPTRFFAGCANFPQAVLSIGWTTSWTSVANNGSYTPEQIDAMVTAIKTNNVSDLATPITFPIRAGIAANSLNELHDLVKAVNDTNESTVTIWGSENDYVDVEKLRKLIFSFGFERVYLDVPDSLSSKLDLSRNDEDEDNSGASLLPSFVKFSLISIGMIIVSVWMQKIQI